MPYSKGDIIKFEDGAMAIVLDNGITGKEFFERYGQQMFCEIFYDGRTLRTYYMTDKFLKDYIWYSVLMGDVNGWRAISTIKESKWSESRYPRSISW